MSAAIEDTFNPAALSNSSAANVSGVKSSNVSSKPAKTTQTFSRIDFEPLYTDLKSCIGHHWAVYHDALTRFIRGELSSSEFGCLTDEFIYANPATEHAHNSLVCAIVYNVSRDNPDIGPAPWVSATSDKATIASSSKTTISSDALEQRLKTEVKALLPRDRKRLKGIVVDDDGSVLKRNAYEEYHNASRIQAPETAMSNTGSLTKTNWELEIKKRYTQSLFAEALEFPDTQAIYARMIPTCYEESVAAGSSMQSAELVAIAAEVYLKDLLGDMFNRTRANGPRYENGGGGGIFTTRFRKQLIREEEEVKSGRLSRSRDDDLLPVESLEAKSRRPLGIIDLKLGSRVAPNPWNGMPLIGVRINEAFTESEYDEWRAEADINSSVHGHTQNGADDMDIDDDYGWEGTGAIERETLGSVLGDCLTIRA